MSVSCCLQRARAYRAAAGQTVIGIALFDDHGLEIHSEPVGDKLCECRLMPLPIRLGGEMNFDGAIIGEMNLGGFDTRRSA